VNGRLVTNVNIIATYIHNNPGCRRTDIKRHLYEARTGEKPLKSGRHLGCNQYFQRHGTASNVYLDRLWYNDIKNMVPRSNNCWNTSRVNRPGKSSYKLTFWGADWVKSPEKLVRPWKEGSLIEWQFESPNRHGWHTHSRRGLVLQRNETYGLWVLGLDGKVHFCSHHAYIRRIREV
jgi:hypothetical protein